ncbi:MAG: Gfo/Idh/MocA family oxidoreductase, partial [Armatimonadota bacterium]
MAGQVSVAVIGVGRIGRLHARNLAQRIPEASLRAISDVNGEALGACARELGVSFAVEDYRAVVEKAEIEAVVICSSTNTHSQIITEAAAAGKHIFCEKPIDLDLNRIEGALGAVEEAGVKLQVGFNRRFDPSFRRAREAVAGGRIGEPHLLRITSRDP